MCQRAKGSDRRGQLGTRRGKAVQRIGRHDGQQRGQRVGDIVIAGEGERLTRRQRLAKHVEHAGAAVVIAVHVGAMHGESVPLSGNAGHQGIDLGAVGRGHPLRRHAGIGEEPLLISVVVGHTAVAIQMIGAERGQDPDVGHDAGRIM